MSEKITIGIHSASWTEHSRRVLQGLLNYIEEYPNIQVRDFRFSSSDPDLAGNPPWTGKVDGVIVSAGRNAGVTTWLRRGKVPVVLATGDMIDSGMVSVYTDVHSVGRLAAAHLTDAGFDHIAYIGYQKSDGSKRRREGLADELAKRGIKLKALALKEAPMDALENQRYVSESTIEKLKTLLEKSPKPLAIVALNDVIGEWVAKCAQELGFSIPDEIGVLGVGDSERARMADPPLSSVQTPGVEIGYRCASLLHSMILGNTPKETVFEVPAQTVVARRSTAGWKRAAVTDIDRAVNYIRDHACDGIRLKDVASAVRIPIRTLEIEFKKQIGRSMGEVIREVRLERVKQLLETTNLSTQRIAAMVGYSHYSYLNKLLRDELNLTPSQYRKQQRKANQES
ncbi:substrate-binding domain-containing protein [Bremerella sp. JC817]|uniref:substrate-binding domain-containing protein n=1 Tax=Bremerella sp. JC817 TaxID=3231756 RepID=UPI0034581150